MYMKSVKLAITTVFTGVALCLAGCGQNSEAKAQLGQPKATGAAVNQLKEDVVTTRAVSIKVPQTVRLTGSLAADEQSGVASKRGGIVREVLVDRGSVVKQGDVLVQLDRTDAENSLAQSEAAAAELMVRLGLTQADQKFDPVNQPDVKATKATLDLAEKNFERDKALFGNKVISPEEYDKTRNALNTARQQYDLAVAQAGQLYRQFQTALTRVKTSRQLLQDMTVVAPFDGAVVERLVSPGESLMDGAKVATLVRINPLRLVLDVPELDVGKLEPGQPVRFTVDAFPGKEFKGTLKRVSPSLNPETRTLKVEAEVPNKDGLLKPGLFATAQVVQDENVRVVSVPTAAVRVRGDTALVFVVKDGISQATMVVPGENNRGRMQIIKGLEGNETVVSDAASVEDGTRIQ